jgi:hypothetical protein
MASLVRFGKFSINKNLISSITIKKRIFYVKYPWKVTITTTNFWDSEFKNFYERELDALLELRFLEEFQLTKNN